MFDEDTIAAISTPLGEGGIGIIRLSGSNAVSIVEKIFLSPKNKTLSGLKSRRIIYGFIIDPSSQRKIDEVLITLMKAPYSYTKEDVVEINCHSGMITLKRILNLVLQSGARLAEPGEFTKRAFLNGRIDLTQAEAVIDLIRSKTDESRRIALEQLQGGLSEKITRIRNRITEVCVHLEAYIDFPEDEIETSSKEEILQSTNAICNELKNLLKTYEEARFFREGLATAIVGRPNVGKSSLLNALLMKDRAIVTSTPGTTRDVIEEYLNIKGLPLRIMDTAGIRDVEDSAEKEGVRRSLKSIENADLVIAIFDCSQALTKEDKEVIEKVKNKNTIYVLNKCDLPASINEETISGFIHNRTKILKISAINSIGLEELKETIFENCIKDWPEEREGVVISNIRHKISIEKAVSALERAALALSENQPLEIISIELREALDALGQIVGIITTEDILNKIFSEFCIGK